MEAAGANRPRYTSATSASSTSTQMTNVSEDSQQPISPTYFVQSSDRMSIIPVFSVDSLDNGQSFVTNTYTCMSFNSGSRANIGQQSFTNIGCKTNKPTSDVSFETRPAQFKAKHVTNVRRQSESVIAEQRESPTFPHRSHTTTCMAHTSMQENADETYRNNLFNPYRPSGSHLSIDNICSFECQCNEELLQRLPSDEIGRQRQRARSVDALERLHVNHMYDTLDQLPRRDTEVCMHQGNTRPVIKLSRKRLNSSLSETPSELNYDRDVTNDAESGYIRTVNVKAGLWESLSVCVKRHTLTILVVINVLVLFVNFALLPYLLLRNSKGGPGEERLSNCFQCSDVSPPMLQDSIVNGHIAQDGDRCCFNTTSWVVQDTDVKVSQVESQLVNLKKMLGEITQKKRSIMYLQSDRSFDIGQGFVIRWSTSETTSHILQGNLKMQYDNRRIQVTETGIFTIRLEIIFVHSIQPNETEKQADLICQLKGYGANGGLSWTIDQFTKTVVFTKDTAVFAGNIDTIVRLKKGNAVGVKCPIQLGNNFVSTVQGAHRISVIEES